MIDKQRCYFVIDMKSFFASVECAERELDALTTNLIVADSKRSDKTICLAVTPAMKKLGVRNRCRLYEIPKDIEYIIAPPRMKKYIEYASRIYEIYLKYIDKRDIHVYSIDECFLDVTDYLKLYKIKAKDFAIKLINEIKTKIHIPASVGIGTNLYLAKIALDITAKHNKDGIGWLTEEKFKKELWLHEPLTDFWGISKGVSERIKKFGITNMKGITNFDESLLYEEFGVNAELLIDHAWGRESCLMSDIKNYSSKSRSISNSQILPFDYSFKNAKIVFKEIIQEGCYRLVRENFMTAHLNIYIGYGNENRSGSKGSVTMKSMTNLYSQILPYAEKLFSEVANKFEPIRKIGFSFSQLIEDKFQQQNFFVDYKKVNKEKNLVKCILELKDKYGKNSILKALDFQEFATQIERNGQIGGHKSGED